MITIQFNGEAKSLEQSQTLSELLNRQDNVPDNFAVAVNEAFVPRSQYDTTDINDGDQIELLVPMQGG